MAFTHLLGYRSVCVCVFAVCVYVYVCSGCVCVCVCMQWVHCPIGIALCKLVWACWNYRVSLNSVRVLVSSFTTCNYTRTLYSCKIVMFLSPCFVFIDILFLV